MAIRANCQRRRKVGTLFASLLFTNLMFTHLMFTHLHFKKNIFIEEGFFFVFCFLKMWTQGHVWQQSQYTRILQIKHRYSTLKHPKEIHDIFTLQSWNRKIAFHFSSSLFYSLWNGECFFKDKNFHN